MALGSPWFSAKKGSITWTILIIQTPTVLVLLRDGVLWWGRGLASCSQGLAASLVPQARAGEPWG